MSKSPVGYYRVLTAVHSNLWKFIPVRCLFFYDATTSRALREAKPTVTVIPALNAR